jgi:adenine-specific DNA-methyltransferase
MEIEKINKTTKIDIKEGLKKIYPEVFEDNKINFEKLKELLNGEIIEKEDDRFYFNWAGKSSIYKLIQASAYGTLKPDKEKSIDFDNTENIVIVGENLETLKLLLKPYFGKVKMIYIDPPYNTGKDFIYRDNFKEPLKDYLEKTGQIDSEGKKLTTNTEASGRYHSDWLNFIYPRLFLARSLLRDDGVIFISIDDNEVHHLRMIMDEIFGKENFRNELIINRFQKSSNGFTSTTESLFLYSVSEKLMIKNIKKQRTCIYCKQEIPLRWTWVHSAGEGKEGRFFNVDDQKVYILPPRGRHWTNKQEEINRLEKEGRIRINKNMSFIDIKGSRINFAPEKLQSENIDIDSNWTDIPGYEFGVFSLWKFSTENSEILLKRVMESTSNEGDLIMDFFLGSGTTTAVAHKLGRKWIGVEMGEHFYSVILPRMKKVLAYDKSGISKELRTPRQTSSDTPLQKRNYEVEFKDGSIVNIKDLDYKLIKPLIWWE